MSWVVVAAWKFPPCSFTYHKVCHMLSMFRVLIQNPQHLLNWAHSISKTMLQLFQQLEMCRGHFQIGAFALESLENVIWRTQRWSTSKNSPHPLGRNLLMRKKILSLMHIFEKYLKLLSDRLASWYKLVQILHFLSSVSLRRGKFLEMGN